MIRSSDDMLQDETDVGMHRISSRIDADGSAELMIGSAAPMPQTQSTPLTESIPMSRSKSTPLGGMSNAMRRVLSRNDRNCNTAKASPLSSLDTTKPGLSPGKITYDMRKVISKEDSEWQSALRNREVQGLVSHQEPVSRVNSRIDESDEGAEAVLLPDKFDDSSLSTAYGLRQVKSTPLRGMGEGYSLKKTKSSSLHKPFSLGKSRTKGSKTKDDGSTTTGSDLSSSLSVHGQTGSQKKRKFFHNKWVIVFFALLVLAGASGGGVYLMKLEMFGMGGDSNPSEMVVSTNLELINVSSSVPSLQPSNLSEVIEISSNLPSLQPSNYSLDTLGSFNSTFSSQTTQEEIIAENFAENTTLTSNETVPDQLAPSSQTENVTEVVESTTDTQNVTGLVESTLDTQDVTEVDPPTTDTQNVTEVELAMDSQNVTAGSLTNDTEIAVTLPATENITLDPSSQNETSSPTTASTEEFVEEEPEDTITTFYVMADAPYNDRERYYLMPRHIDQIEDDGEFLVHLGDLQYAAVDRCREGAYFSAAQILRRARMPTFVLPGDNDINDCSSMSHGEAMWMKYFHQFDNKYLSHSFDVTRWGRLQESFGFLHKRVLFLGLNMVGGTPYSWSEKTERHREHLEQVRGLFRAHEGQFDVIVLLKHAEPGRNHRDFFGDGDGDGLFIDMIRRMGKPTIHFHGDYHEYYEEEADLGVENYMRISLDGESVAPPIRVTIDVSKRNPITVSRRQNNLRVKCCAEGWPRI